MLITVRHELAIPFDGAATRAVEHLLLTPLSAGTQVVKEWAIETAGIETAARFTDAFGNRALLVTRDRPDETQAIVVRGAVEAGAGNGVIGRIPGEPVVALFRRITEATKPDAELVEAFASVDRAGRGRIDLFHDLMGRLYEAAEAEPAEEASQSQSQPDQSQSQSQSSEPSDDAPTRDPVALSHRFIGVLRALELPARFVTGYVASDDDGPGGWHAWAEAYDDSLGWIGFDCALGICPTDRHIRVAVGLDAGSIPPVRTIPVAAIEQGAAKVTAG
jgi:transglutaminase-like putative cysteine protease